MAKKKAATKPKKKTTTAKSPVKKKVAKKSAAKKTPARKTASKKAPAKKVAQKPAARPVKKKGVRRATMTTGIRAKKAGKKMGRSRIPTDAPLSVVFQNDLDAQEAFAFLGIHTVRELEEFDPDQLVMKLTSPAKQTVGRIRKILAMNNRCLEHDEAFALEFQEKLASMKLRQ
ncbi:hypothetical protein [Fuerstiella marisgermanici]|uniref:Uncharacterized protein n=1 Tax=Fuerstiella marisgermanici TaxID=1891926 RepID=A0A1P8W8S7_9PLAN|nr:hypothetical protein [Fuerstiella marisgermanici]APZ90452.1 hypothetical protein Fuma_00026 [Fuerstiella marisgermanici]